MILTSHTVHSGLVLLILCFCITHILCSHKPVGYIGPACVVVDDLLYLHGNYIRRLTLEELAGFQKYQEAVAIQTQLRDALSKGTASVSNGSTVLATPVLPVFCNGLDDQIEVVLDGCTVRNSRVYIADRLIRPLSNGEVEKVNALIRLNTYARLGYSQQPSAARRQRRSSITTGASALGSLDLLGHFLNVNTSVIERFLPRVRASPVPGTVESMPQQATTIDGSDTARKRRVMEQIESLGGKESGIAAGNSSHDAESKSFLLPLNNDDRSDQPPNGPTSSLEIPHLVLGASDSQYYNSPPRSSPTQSAPVHGGGADQLNINDPALLNLLYSLASQQPNAGQIQAFQNPPSSTAQVSPHAFTSSFAGMSPGDRMMIGGQAYVAVPLNTYSPSTPTSSASATGPLYPTATGLGLMPVNQPQYPQNSWHYNNGQQAIWSSSSSDAADGVAPPHQTQANSGQLYHSPLGGVTSQTSGHAVNSPQPTRPNNSPPIGGWQSSQFAEPKFSTPLATLSNDICQAHIMEPFRMVWFSSQHR